MFHENILFFLILFQYFADVRILDGRGRSALWHAKSAGSKECADILRHNGCNDLGTMIPQGGDVFVWRVFYRGRTLRKMWLSTWKIASRKTYELAWFSSTFLNDNVTLLTEVEQFRMCSWWNVEFRNVVFGALSELCGSHVSLGA